MFYKEEGFLEGVLRRGFREGTQKAETRLFESTTPLACALIVETWPDMWGPDFIHPHAQRLKIPLYRVGVAHEREGGFLQNSCCEGAFDKCTHPTLSLERKIAFWPGKFGRISKP